MTSEPRAAESNSTPDEGNGRVFGRLVRGLMASDPLAVERATIALSTRSRWLAPLAFVAGALALTIVGIKTLIVNWRLTLVELFPAAWLWVSMYNLRHHVFDGTRVRELRPSWWIAVGMVYVAVAVVAFLCNAIFAVALATGDHNIRRSARIAWLHQRLLLFWGLVIGLGHAICIIWISRIGSLVYDLAQSAVLLVSMVTFISVPAKIAGVQKVASPRRDRVAMAAVGSTMAAVVSTPGFILDRLGLLLLATSTWHWFGVAVLSMGVALQLAATTSTKAVKLSTILVTRDTSTSSVP